MSKLHAVVCCMTLFRWYSQYLCSLHHLGLISRSYGLELFGNVIRSFVNKVLKANSYDLSRGLKSRLGFESQGFSLNHYFDFLGRVSSIVLAALSACVLLAKLNIVDFDFSLTLSITLSLTMFLLLSLSYFQYLFFFLELETCDVSFQSDISPFFISTSSILRALSTIWLNEGYT